MNKVILMGRLTRDPNVRYIAGKNGEQMAVARYTLAVDRRRKGADEIVDTGVHMQIPDGWFGKIESKSGLNIRRSIVAPGGVIDAGYRGPILIRLKNDGTQPHTFERGDKVEQIVIQPCLLCDFNQVNELDPADSGEKGIGSTGR